MFSKKAIILSFISCFGLIANLSWSYDGEVHFKISENATTVSKLDSILRNQLGLNGGTAVEMEKSNVTKQIWEWIAFGGEAEDFGKKGVNAWRPT